MNSTIKAKKFCLEPMERKSIIAVPGIGPSSAKKLAVKGIVQAPQLYKIFLHQCNADKVEFLKWTKSNCKLRAKDFDSCYDAFRRWKNQFPTVYAQNTDDHRPSDIGNTTRGRFNTARKGILKKTSANADVLNLSKNDDVETTDPLVSFFESLRQTVQTLPPLKQVEIKNKIYSIVSLAEAENIHTRAEIEPVASPFQSSAGKSQSSRTIFKRPQQSASWETSTNNGHRLSDDAMTLD